MDYNLSQTNPIHISHFVLVSMLIFQLALCLKWCFPFRISNQILHALTSYSMLFTCPHVSLALMLVSEAYEILILQLSSALRNLRNSVCKHCKNPLVLWHDFSKQELRSQHRYLLLGNSFINSTVAR
jgi:hypothetical protein